MNHRNILIVAVGMLIGLTALIADRKETSPVEIPGPEKSALQFIENQGQWEEVVEYAVRMNGGDLILEKQGLTYDFFTLPEQAHPHSHTSDSDHHAHDVALIDEVIPHHVLKVDFLNANPNPRIEPQAKFSEYHNYFIGDDPAKWAGKVALYGRMLYHDVYQGIDFRMYGSGENVKYDFIVAPGANPDDIQLRYRGADRIFLKDGALHVKTSVREVIELPPFVYQQNGGLVSTVACRYKLTDNVLSFEFPEGYDQTLPLIIDPTLEFSTYTGAFGDNWGFTATYDMLGNLYAGGIIFAAGGGPTNYPITPGAYQNNFRGGGSEATITKFSSNGSQRVYSTYLGGNDLDQPHSLVANDDGELYVFGRTASINFPTAFNGYDRQSNGGFDIFITKFDSTGSQLLGGTYLGGSGNDAENGNYFGTGLPPTVLQYNYGDDARGEIILDGAGNVYLASCTKSNNFPVTPNAFQGSFSGSQDGVVVKMTGDLTSLMWSSYLGGGRLDAAYGMKVDAQNNLYVTGGTNSNNFPAVPGGLNTAYQGGSADGFIVKVAANGNTLLAGTYIGTSSYDQAYFLELDEDENVYVAGQTMGNYPVVGNVWNVANSRQFITKLNNNLSQIEYSTRIGSSGPAAPNISPTAFLVDRCENVYLAGWGGSTNQAGNTFGMATTPDAIQSFTDGSDFYMIVLERDARNLLYASYLGGNNAGGSGEHVDGGTCRFDREGIVYHAVCAGCGGFSTFPTTPGVVSNTNNSANCNLAAFKISFNLAGIEANFFPRDKDNLPLQFSGCAPLQVNFLNQTINAAAGALYFWEFGDNTPGSALKNPTHVYETPGTYRVRMVVIDSTSCNITDTAYADLIIFEPPVAAAGPDQIICEGDSVLLTGSGAGGQGSYIWGPGSVVSQTSGQNTFAFPTVDQNIFLTAIDSNGCRDTDTLRVTIDRTLQIIAKPDTEVCEGVSVRLNATTNGIDWSWSPASTLTDSTLINPLATPDSTTTYVITAINARGCEEQDSMTVAIYEVFTLEDTTLCQGDTMILLTSNGVSFSWSPNYNISDPNTASPLIWPDTSTVYTIDARSADGCFSTKDVFVEVVPPPTADAGPDDTLCIGFSTQLQASGGLQYIWLPEDYLDNPRTANPTVSPDSTITYTVTVIDANGCTDDDDITVVVNDLPTIIAGPEMTICEGEALQLYAAGASTYIWDPDTTLSALNIPNPLATPSVSTTYRVTGIDDNGCENDTSFTVDVTQRPNVEIEGVNFLCVGGSIELTAFGGERVVWSTGDTSRTIKVNPVGLTTYTVTPYIGDCMGFPQSITLDEFYDYPEASFTFSPEKAFAPQEVLFSNTSLNASSYVWDYGTGAQRSEDVNPAYTFPFAGNWTIMLIAISETGCRDTAYDQILLENVALHVPSAFTPNGDEHNNYFLVGHYGVQTMNVRIYSRWGIKIYESDNPDFQWDGTYKGKNVPEGVYVYVITGFGENGLKYERKGTVTVFR